MKTFLQRSGSGSRAPRTPRHRSGEALGELCEAYWQPVYTFIRRKGHDPDRPLDLTQGFFALLVEPGPLGAVTPAKGKFRSFLMAACSHFLSNQRVYDRATASAAGAEGRSRSTIPRPRAA